MDMITIAMAKKYADGQRLGYIEPGEVLTYDGNGETSAVGDYQFAKIADKGRDLTKVKSITVMLGGTDSVTLSGDALSVSTDEELGVDFLNANYIGMSLPAVVDLEVLGLAVFDGAQGYVSRIEFAETIHTIDPKFLPGVCLPVVELSTINGALTPEEAAKMDEVTAMGVPIVVKLAGLAAEVCAYSSGGEGMFAYVGIYVTVTNQTGNWIIEVTG